MTPIPSTWVLADSFDAVPHHVQELDLFDPKLCELLEREAHSVRAPFESEGAQRLECETCYGFGWLVERGCSAWYRKARVADPVSYEFFYEHLDSSSISCPSCTSQHPRDAVPTRYITWAEYHALLATA